MTLSETKSEDCQTDTGTYAGQASNGFKLSKRRFTRDRRRLRRASGVDLESVAEKCPIQSVRSALVGLTPKKQIQCWTDALTDLCGHFDVDPMEASSFEGRINYTTVSRLKLCQIETSQHRIAQTISRAKLSEHPFVKIHFQTHGISYFEQDGRRIEVMPGDCLAYDVSCPHTIVSPSLTRHEVVIVPKELLQERGFRLAKMSAVQTFCAHRHRPDRL